MTPQRRVVLVGGGHAHLQVIPAAPAFRQRGGRLTVICPRAFWYSGLATAMLGGDREPADDRIDIADLCRRHGVEWIDTTATAIDPAARRLTLADGRTVDFTAASLNIGSEVAPPDTSVADDARLWTVKPIADLARLRTHIEAGGGTARIAVAGGGPTGCEVTANLVALCRCRDRRADIALYNADRRLLPTAAAGAGRRVQDSLEARDVTVHHGRAVTPDSDGRLHVDGHALDADVIVLATGLRAVALARSLASDDTDGVPVTGALHHPAYPWLFAAGDCAHFLPRPLPKAGVFGVRQGPVLRRNLLARLDGRPPVTYVPQRHYLSILDLGDDTGLALYGSFWWHGRTALRLKHRLDERFLHGHRC